MQLASNTRKEKTKDLQTPKKKKKGDDVELTEEQLAEQERIKAEKKAKYEQEQAIWDTLSPEEQ